MIPVRCFTCGKVLGNMEDTCDSMLRNGCAWSEIFEKLSVRRYCCRMVLMSYHKD